MQSENNTQKKTGKRVSAVKVILWTIFFLLLFILIPFFAIPAYISSSGGRDLILSKVNSSIDGRVEVDSLSMSWLEGVKADKFNFTNNAGTTKITADQLAARPSYLALISGRVVIDEAKIDRPYVSINLSESSQHKEQGTSNEKPVEHKVSAPAVPLDRLNLTISEGNFKITAPDAEQNIRTLEMRNINSKIALRPLGSKSSFDVSMTVAGANEISSIAASGRIKTAKKQWSLEGATGELSADINGLDISTLGPLLAIVDAGASASGRVTANAEAKLQNGQFENLRGFVNAVDLDVTGSFLKGDRLQSSRFLADVNLSTTEKVINIDRLAIEADGLGADVRGTVPRTLRSFEDFMKADSDDTLQAQFDCDVAKTFKQIKTVAHFKQDFDINYGRLSGVINTQGQKGKRTLTGKIKLWALEGKFPVRRIILSKPVELDAKIVSQNQIITVEKLLIDSAFAKASLTGTADDISYTADLDLAKMQSDVGQFIEIKPQLSGTAQLSGKGTFAENIFASTGNASVSNLIVTMPDGVVLSENAATAGFDFQADLNKKQLTARQADISASFGKIDISNLTAPLGADSPSPLAFNTVFAVELAKLNDWLAALGKTDADTRYSGFARGDLALKKTGSVLDIATKQIDIENLKVTSPGKEAFSQPNMTIALKGKFDTERKIYDIPKLNISSPQIKIAGNISNSQTGQTIKTQGEFKADYDLAAAGSIVSPFLPQGFSAAGKRSDSLVFSSVYPKNQPDQFKANLNAKTTFGFDSAKYIGLDIGKSEFNVKIENGLMIVSPFTTVVNKGKLNFGCSANFGGKPVLLKTPGQMKIFDNIQITRQTSDALLQRINPIFADATNISGILNYNSEKLIFPLQKGYDKTIDSAGTLSITNMRLGSPLLNVILQLIGGPANPIITVRPTRITIANGVISYDNMQMDIDKYPVNFTGTIGLDKKMNMRVTLPWSHNRQRITLPLKGSVDKPELDVEKLIEEQARQEIERQLQKIFK